jgi:oxygen-independent coproporphyrinogen-3 oxidase
LAASGVNRLSLGIQSLDPERLRFLGRPHTAREALAAVDLARQAGFGSLNLDLLWGAPGQRERRWLEELTAVCALKPDHLSCYCLTVEEGTPLESDCLAGRATLPPERELAAMYVHGSEYLESQGLLQYEISSYARMGFQCRHNLGYWEGAEYLGLGPSAVSTLNGTRWSNPPDLKDWAAAVRSGDRDGERLDSRTQVLETVMLRLRTSRGLSLKTYRDLTGRDFMRDHEAFVHLLHREGLLRIRGGALSLTRTGMLVADTILERLFDALERLLDDAGA